MHYFERTIACGLINQEFLGKTVRISGWVNTRRDHGGLIFIDLRDRTGLMQLVFNPDFSKDAHNAAHALRSEFVISVVGVVVERAAGTTNKDLATGKWELQVTELVIENKCKALPFSLDEAGNVDEELRLKYRYIDLRRASMREKFALRHEVIFAMRECLHQQGFYEIETPILTKNTPEGAREFLVPSRTHERSFYAMPQSPQLYKQLLMASGMEKYFQVARCFRDEDLRADRQPEFTQLDIEMSFVKEGNVIEVIEKLLAHVWKKTFNIDIVTPFPRLVYAQAFSMYGSDKPDLRYALKINDITSLFAQTELKFLRSVLDTAGKVGALHVNSHDFSRSELDAWVTKAQKFGAKGLLWMRFKDEQTIESPISKFLPVDFFAQVKTVIPDLKPSSVLFIIAGEYNEAWTLLGRLRCQMAKELGMIPENEFNFSWVTDFPLFEYDKENKRWDATHHPFTSPQDGWETQQPGEMTARAYDVVLNGVELGGGSIRIHDAQVQDKVFKLLGLTKEQVEKKFGFLLEAQQLGFPPHGGIALGLDRLIMLMSNSSSIREVIAFPKTASGYDPLMDGPAEVEESQLQDYGLKFAPKKKD
ncbi:MAG TPA: aspartate--tRNA ligase [Candidatus Babeliales bacterium]|nr:aspartate--tRNA ligase [Candidatus Babeliales bacterium]